MKDEIENQRNTIYQSCNNLLAGKGAKYEVECKFAKNKIKNMNYNSISARVHPIHEELEFAEKKVDFFSCINIGPRLLNKNLAQIVSALNSKKEKK